MSVHVRLVSPVTTHDPHTQAMLDSLSRPDLQLSVVELACGPPSIESEYDEVLAEPDTLRLIVEAEREGVDAIVIDCMGDPGLHPARELVSIPVVGPGEIAFHTAAMLGERFSVITVLDRVRPLINRKARDCGMAAHMAPARAVGIPVVDLAHDFKKVERALCEESLKAVREDDVAVIVLGCTGFVGLAQTIGRFLMNETGRRIPVIDAIPLAILSAAAWVTAGISQSEITYPASTFGPKARPSPRATTG